MKHEEVNKEIASRGAEAQRSRGERGKSKKSNPQSPIPNPQSPLPLIPRGGPTFPNLDNWLEIGKIVSPQGLSGELKVYPVSDFPERFEMAGKRWLLRSGDTEPQPIELLTGRYISNKNLYVIKLAGVENCDQAEALRGCKLMVPVSDRPQLGEDEYHVLDLIGLEVFMQVSGELVGTVVDIIPAGNDLLEVKLDESFTTDKGQMTNDKKQKTVLIPFVEAIAPVVDLPSGRIEITPPPGLLEINN
ncbi:ribosome maturation factor RimM [Nostoc sp. 'Lobaria pulmonaria (5183) cyanobiont']|uniref:ribosome maturation factor RimM n=1 Tax=Nostoc sp. 'Lobaria pulmonaria (5183) cyanobiont' TaxID=1618022 RepID=UPI000CF36085|nr:ribosome maturation factor RimM [Nostoc sp. 'Lobaria pulmonaria (5183) cyanobiont']AVH69687.1 16S rRNA processing protein RimM [Nostoc sp. 'Lobaria pulmonaria (5183) cyanobiont']